ncbi:hypothetical protein GT347_12515 [Xylophilus rhododendri]|uniref:Uncharacterized protein n=1 Tax=Xylophilus rhododendri TaxID=2697032 RepID=A0A857J468_9BURK|nr:hypothetical protein [Xylophilus rhododendri]QHI98740.1 hypothetical protein GT347_12515 [Xylophilus rhododendri]
MHLSLSSTTFPAWHPHASTSVSNAFQPDLRGCCVDPLQDLLSRGLTPSQVAGMQVTVVGPGGGAGAQAGVAQAWDQVRKSFARSSVARPAAVAVQPVDGAAVRQKVYTDAVTEFQALFGKTLGPAPDKLAACRQRLAELMLLRPAMHIDYAQALCRAEAWSTEQVFGRSPPELATLLLRLGWNVLQRQRLEAALRGAAPRPLVDAVDDFCGYLADCIERIDDFRDATGLRPDPLTPEQRLAILEHDLRSTGSQAGGASGRRLLRSPGQ